MQRKICTIYVSQNSRWFINYLDFAKISLGVLFHIIICENGIDHSPDGFLTSYIAKLETIGGVVVITKNNENCDDCVLTSQMIRLLAFRVPEVSKQKNYFTFYFEYIIPI